MGSRRDVFRIIFSAVDDDLSANRLGKSDLSMSPLRPKILRISSMVHGIATVTHLPGQISGWTSIAESLGVIQFHTSFEEISRPSYRGDGTGHHALRGIAPYSYAHRQQGHDKASHLFRQMTPCSAPIRIALGTNESDRHTRSDILVGDSAKTAIYSCFILSEVLLRVSPANLPQPKVTTIQINAS